ncbi:hypothetical protein UZ38_40230, partial [Bacillus amyloliquefaciens]
ALKELYRFLRRLGPVILKVKLDHGDPPFTFQICSGIRGGRLNRTPAVQKNRHALRRKSYGFLKIFLHGFILKNFLF